MHWQILGKQGRDLGAGPKVSRLLPGGFGADSGSVKRPRPLRWAAPGPARVPARPGTGSHMGVPLVGYLEIFRKIFSMLCTINVQWWAGR